MVNAAKTQKGRWRGMDADKDMSDDQVNIVMDGSSGSLLTGLQLPTRRWAVTLTSLGTNEAKQQVLTAIA